MVFLPGARLSFLRMAAEQALGVLDVAVAVADVNDVFALWRQREMGVEGGHAEHAGGDRPREVAVGKRFLGQVAVFGLHCLQDGL